MIDSCRVDHNVPNDCLLLWLCGFVALVEVHESTWWRMRMEAMGFVYLDFLTNQVHKKAREDLGRTDFLKAMNATSNYSVAQHLWTTMIVSNC